jgi:hypothetical protein
MAGATDGGDLTYCLKETHFYFRLVEGPSRRNEASLRLKNQGNVPIWAQFQDFQCSVMSEGVDVLYTCPILPGQYRDYSLLLNAVTYKGTRRCKSTLRKDTHVTFTFNVGVHTRLPDGFDSPLAKTAVYCSVVVPAGLSTRFKLVRAIE